ncbi:putative ankyrin repeat domain protein [Phaeoacremonium minimum UCRPA7]|uniref:Putative ankyrin repeat domain protein n=1 Tax=Phaeoacremonium minimum (strain UCR-PA7) TaxID=1286976 RepID=R8BD25_PHAM7|nr:putative ankyrin repeat domain protein [Phaeoacremonium minimum UCRPA7]EON97195.1 putative ankyrin repeat domain protein [Phaeoacremonium minimum UCRPA7]
MMNINAENNMKRTPLHLACNGGHLSTANLLLTNGADVNHYDVIKWTPLNWAIVRNHTHLAEVLVASGAEVNPQSGLSRCALYLAAENGLPGTVRLLLSRGANVEGHANPVGVKRPLLGAVDFQKNVRAETRLDIVKQLVDAGADIGAKDERQKTAADRVREKAPTMSPQLFERFMALLSFESDADIIKA